MEVIDIIARGTSVFIGKEEVLEKLKEGRPLNIKFGVDPTRPDLTFGHLVVFNKLRQLQELGHNAILLIGDYSAQIGDPSGRSATRPVLTPEDVERNSETYLAQAFKILDKSKTIVRRNSEWFNKMGFGDLLNLARKMTVAQMLERDDFSKRYKEQAPISIVEFLYPLLQGYDSVVLKADVELGGQDQLFNLLAGRVLQKDAGQSEQAVICLPLLVGLDGVKKMSKSYDNYIAFNDTSANMFGKLMSIPDNTMWDYFTLLLQKTEDEIQSLKKEHPMVAKKQLALSLVEKFFTEEIAKHELDQFEKVFSKKEFPENLKEFRLNDLCENGNTITDMMMKTGLFPSKKEIRRLFEQGAIKINHQKLDDPNFLPKADELPLVIQAGKRTFFKIV